MTKHRLDIILSNKGMVSSRSQAESYIKLGFVTVNGKQIKKPGYFVSETDDIKIDAKEQFVSRAALKLASIANDFKIDFNNKVVLDVGSSTGGFTEYAIRQGAKKVIAVDVGTKQMHPKLRTEPKIELHEQTDIRDFETNQKIDLVLADVSFISLKMILPKVKQLANQNTMLVIMCKPQFEASARQLNKGVVKNNAIRRTILNDFEVWLKANFIVLQKADSKIAGEKGNLERFYKLKVAKK